MASEKCAYCGRQFEPVWFQREDLRIRRERHELRCIHKSPAEREYYLRYGRWRPSELNRKKPGGKRAGARGAGARDKRPAGRAAAARRTGAS
jgi:hypothetical protein